MIHKFCENTCLSRRTFWLTGNWVWKIFHGLDRHLSNHVHMACSNLLALCAREGRTSLGIRFALTVLSCAVVGLAGWWKSTGASRGKDSRNRGGVQECRTCQHCRLQDADQATLPDIYDLRSRCFRRQSREGQAALVPSLIANAWNIWKTECEDVWGGMEQRAVLQQDPARNKNAQIMFDFFRIRALLVATWQMHQLSTPERNAMDDWTIWTPILRCTGVSWASNQLLEQSKAEELQCVRLCKEALCTDSLDCLHLEKWKQTALQDFLYFAMIIYDYAGYE